MARQPLVIESKVGTSGSWYRVRVTADSRGDAEKLCSGLRAAGGSCLVQRN
jgi:cell division protein FtsN